MDRNPYENGGHRYFRINDRTVASVMFAPWDALPSSLQGATEISREEYEAARSVSAAPEGDD